MRQRIFALKTWPVNLKSKAAMSSQHCAVSSGVDLSLITSSPFFINSIRSIACAELYAQKSYLCLL